MGQEAFLAAQILDFAESTDDRVAALLQAGTGITLTYNDGAGTLTIASTVSPTWGSIGGTLSSQIDLQTALDGKSNAGHTHVIADTTGLQSALDAKLGGSTGSIDNRILRADGTGGATVQSSAVTIDDSGNINSGASFTTNSNLGWKFLSAPAYNPAQTTGLFHGANGYHYWFSEGVAVMRFNGGGGIGEIPAIGVTGVSTFGNSIQVTNPLGNIFGIIRSGNNVLFDGGRKGGASSGSFLASETSSGYAFDGGWGGVRASSGIGLSNLLSSPYNWTIQCGTGYGAIVSNGTNAMFFRVNRTFTSDSQQHYYAIVTNNGSNQYDIGTVNNGVGNFTTRFLNNGTSMLEFGNDNTQIILRQRVLTFGSANSGEIRLSATAFGSVLNVIDALSSSTYQNVALGHLLVGGASSATTARIKNTSGTMNFRLGNDSADCNITAASAAFTGLVTVGTYTVATLPSAAANAGALAQVTDSSVTTNGSAVAGGGANRVLVFSNGSTWDVVVA